MEQGEVDRIVCASVATQAEGVYAQMESIRASELKHNEPLGLHAVLLHLSGWFVHWLEGPHDAVRQTLRRVSHDPRHWSPRIVHFSRGPRLLHDPWSMMLVPSPAKGTEIAERVMRLREEVREGRQCSAPGAVRRLATPLQPSVAAHVADPDAFHRVGFCSADSQHAFALVKMVGHAHRQEVLHRRVAGEGGHDMGFDAVDFLLGEWPCRVNALPWQSLQQGLLRLYLPDWQFMVLMFSGSSRTDDMLMQRVCKLLARLAGGPKLLAAAPNEQTHLRLEQLAREAGVPYDRLATCPQSDIANIWDAVSLRIQALGAPATPTWEVASSMPAGLEP
jgi:hypothetical protein